MLYHTKSSHRPPHPGCCSSQPRPGSNWTKEFSSSRATGHHINVGNLASDWHQTPSPCSGSVVHKSHWTKQHTVLWDPSNPAVSQCCPIQLGYSATVVAGKGTTMVLGGPPFQALLIRRRMSSHMGVSLCWSNGGLYQHEENSTFLTNNWNHKQKIMNKTHQSAWRGGWGSALHL